MTDPATAHERWEKAYDEAIQWRDWQKCDRLLDEREASAWYVLFLYEEDDANRRALSAAVVERVSAYTGTRT